MIGIGKYYADWVARRESRRAARLTKKAADLSEDQVYDLVLLYKRGLIRARATGQSITAIHGEVENLLLKPLRVRVAPGTYFVARGNFQNMVTRRAYNFKFGPNERKLVSIEATCINAGRPIPKSSDRFNGVAHAPVQVSRFIEAAEGADPMVIQTGVWALTDNYSAAQVRSHLVAQDRYGSRRPAVSDLQIAEARRILDNLGIRHQL
jgi:hypothetical protein